MKTANEIGYNIIIWERHSGSPHARKRRRAAMRESEGKWKLQVVEALSCSSWNMVKARDVDCVSIRDGLGAV